MAAPALRLLSQNAPDPEPEDWPRKLSYSAIAQRSCTRRFGLGKVATRGQRFAVCACVYRRIFRACWSKYLQCQDMFGYLRAVSFERVGRAQGRRGIVAGFKHAEYIADLELTARRVLANKPVELAVFRAHYLLGYEWRQALPVVTAGCA